MFMVLDIPTIFESLLIVTLDVGIAGKKDFLEHISRKLKKKRQCKKKYLSMDGFQMQFYIENIKVEVFHPSIK